MRKVHRGSVYSLASSWFRTRAATSGVPRKTTRPFGADDATVAIRERIARATVEAEASLMCKEVCKFTRNILPAL